MSASALLRSLVRGAEDLLAPNAYLLVRDGEAFAELPESVPLTGGALATVVRTPSELHLRHALWRAQGRPLIALVPPSLDCPADLREQAVRHKIHTLSMGEVLQAVLGTRVIGVDDAELNQLAIDYAEQIRQRLNLHTTPTVVDRALLERTLVEVVGELADLGLTRGEFGPLVAQWALDPPRWSAPVRKLAMRVLQQQGPFGQIVAWAAGEAQGCRNLVVHGAVLSAEGELSDGAWGPLSHVRDNPDAFRLDPSAVRSHLVSLATDAIAVLGQTNVSQRDALLDQADTLARHAVHGSALRASNLLPLAFVERAHSIAQRLANADANVVDDLRALDAHTLAASRSHERELLGEMARLARYLAVPRALPADPSAMASDYATDHAFADLCLRRLERARAQTAAFRDAAVQLTERVIAARDALNRAWAERLSQGYKGALLTRPEQTLQQLTRAQVAEELRNKRVFLLVLDGCSVPVWLDLLDQLTALPQPIGLSRRQPPRDAHFALSPLPTITSHARGALFLGAVPKDPFTAETTFAAEEERKTDPARFKQNAWLGSASRQLFLKGDLTDDSRELQSVLATDVQVVAAVYNAVDDRIGSHNTGQAWRMDVVDIRGLLPTLRTAIAAGRSILVTADHGHSPFRGNRGFVGAGSTPRYALLGPGDPVPDGFIEIDCAGLSGQEGRMAFAWKQGAYRGQQQVGFHGGCGLEEMVVPVAWLQAGTENLPRPPWWHTLVTEAPPPPVAPQERVAELRAQQPEPVAVNVSGLPQDLRDALAEADQRILAYVLAHGPVRSEDLAKLDGRPVHRMRGYLAQLARKLQPLGVTLTATDLDGGARQWSAELP